MPYNTQGHAKTKHDTQYIVKQKNLQTNSIKVHSGKGAME